MKRFLEIGEIVGTHGIKGEMRLHPWADSPDFLRRFHTLYFDGDGKQPMKITSCRPHGNVVLIKMDGIDSVEKASALRGRILYMDRQDAGLKDGNYFIQDLIGCRVLDADNPDIIYGKLTNVSPTGANDVWHIRGRDEKEYLIPAIKDVVIEVNVMEGWVRIRPLKGIFDDED